MDRIGNILEKYINSIGIDQPILKYKALGLWHQVVGERISEVSEPEYLSNGKMFVKVKNDSWRNELVFHKQEIILKLNDKLGHSMVKDIVFL